MTQRLVLRDDSGATHQVEVGPDGACHVDGRTVEVVPLKPGEVRAGGRPAWVSRDGDVRWVFIDGRVHRFATVQPGAGGRRQRRHDAALSAPMPATVLQIRVAPGDRVQSGDVLLTLEAMKMELPVRAPAAGTVRAVNCREGELVQPGQDLIDLDGGDDAPAAAARP